MFFMPGKDIPSSGFWVWLNKIYFDKIVHFGLFFVLIVLIAIPILKSHLTAVSKLRAIIGFAFLAIGFGIATEFIQDRFVSGRSFDLRDWAADSLGVVAAFYFIQRIKTAFPE